MAERYRGVKTGAGIPWAGACLEDEGSWVLGVRGSIVCRDNVECKGTKAGAWGLLADSRGCANSRLFYESILW